MAKRGSVIRSTIGEEDEKIRPVRIRRYRYLILVVCEDEKTEPYYFAGFEDKIPPESIFIRTVGTGKTSLGVVLQAIEEKSKLESQAGKTVDEIWVVFDKDDADLIPANAERFAQAFEKAKSQEIQVAFSNEVFELWLLLHLEDVDPAVLIPRSNLYDQLEKVIRQFSGYENFKYEHGKSMIIDVIREIGNEEDAMKRAKNLQEYHGAKDPILANPKTMVDQLVSSLRSWIAYFSYER